MPAVAGNLKEARSVKKLSYLIFGFAFLWVASFGIGAVVAFSVVCVLYWVIDASVKKEIDDALAEPPIQTRTNEEPIE